MANNKNKNSLKGNRYESRTGANQDETRGNRSLPDNPENNPEESISTAGDTSDGKYSNTGMRDEDIDNDETRGGL